MDSETFTCSIWGKVQQHLKMYGNVAVENGWRTVKKYIYDFLSLWFYVAFLGNFSNLPAPEK